MQSIHLGLLAITWEVLVSPGYRCYQLPGSEGHHWSKDLPTASEHARAHATELAIRWQISRSYCGRQGENIDFRTFRNDLARLSTSSKE